MRRLTGLYQSTIGKKVAMAVSGVIFVLFVIGHMAGNLKAFQGPEKFNEYAEFLREVGTPLVPHGGLLWVARIALLVALAVHVVAAIQLTRNARAARPQRYRQPVHLEISYASRTMRWGGVILFFFVVYHILHITLGTVHQDFVPGDAYHNLVAGFQQWPVTVAYLVAMGALGLHLYHGAWSMFQTLGANHQRYNPLRRAFAVAVSLVVVVGFITVPLAITFGAIS